MAAIRSAFRVVAGAAFLLANSSLPSFAWRSINFTPTDFGSQNSFQYGLANIGVTTMNFNFMLPGDYKTGTTAKLRIMMWNTGASACSIFFGVSEVHRARAGFADVLGAPETHGMPDGPMKLVTLDPKKRMIFAFQIKPMTTGTITGQKPGDAMQILVDRDADAMGDNCAAVFVNAAEVRYTPK